MQSSLLSDIGLHVAIIMDGNGRWAKQRGLPRAVGHRAGVTAVSRIVNAAPALGIRTITLFAFSCDNWRRPAGEVDTLMWLMRRFLPRATARYIADGVRLSFIGRRDRLSASLLESIRTAEAATSFGARLHVRIALDYSSRDAIARASTVLDTKSQAGNASDARNAIDLALTGCDGAGPGTGPGTGPVDLVIRTGGEKRLSDFLLWESAYAELWFTDMMWPDFDAAALAQAVADFYGRERRFGGLPKATPSLREAG